MNATSKMEVHALDQGSSAWLAHRARCWNASDAGAMRGESPHKSRSQLLAEAHSGLAREHSDFVQERILPDGHRTESLLRPLAQEIVGEEFYPIVASREWPGLSRPLGASYDGLTIARDVGFECKRLNDELRKALPHGDAGKNDWRALPLVHQAQVTQQFMVCPTLQRVLFGAGEFDRDGNLVDARWVWCTPDVLLQAEIAAGWQQFERDLAEYVPPAASTVEKVVAEPVEAFPAPVVQVSGQLALQDNFKVFEERLRHFLEHRLIREPKSDQDFADLDQQIKAMKAAREALSAAEAQMLAQVQPVDQAKKTKDMLDKLLQQNCSMAERLLKDEKERRREAIVAAGVKAFEEHRAALNTRLGKPYLPQIPTDFAGCVKGLKSLASMEDKVATELARAKIAANEVADKIEINLRALREQGADYRFLFNDAAALVLKAPEDCKAVITARIAEHKAEAERRAAELAERERARIRAEEEAKLRREQEEREAAERRRQEEEARAATPAPTAAPAADRTYAPLRTVVPPAPAPVPVFRESAAAQPVLAPAPPTLKLGSINEKLGILTITADGLAQLGFPVVATERGAKLYREADLPRMIEAAIGHLNEVLADLAAEVAA